MNKRVFLVVIMWCALVFAQDFVIGAYGVDSIGLFSNAHDSLGLNTVLYGTPSSYSDALNALSVGENETLQIILSHAPCNAPPWRRLTWYADLWHKLWESEEDQIYFSHAVGKAIYDASASHDSAWVCSLNVHQAGIMQTGRSIWQWQLRIPTNGHFASDSVRYTAQFWLKIDTMDVNSNTPVCSLAIYDPEQDSIFKDSILRIRDFPGADQYYAFDLQFRKKPWSMDLIWFVIYWYDNVSLWADYVEVKDCYVDSLTTLREYDDPQLKDIAELYSPFYCQYKSLYRFYLRDEPYYGHFAANRYLMDFLEEEPTYQYGIQAMGGADKTFFQDYADSIKPHELLMDYYPFRGEGFSGGPTPEDSGAVFQQRLSSLCTALSAFRNH